MAGATSVSRAPRSLDPTGLATRSYALSRAHHPSLPHISECRWRATLLSLTDSIAFAEAIGASWGLPMASLNQRSKRAHNGTQYLSYEYGKVDAFRVYDYIQAQLPASARKVEPYLLQACNIQSARADAATVALVKSCLGI
jgi:hypothetical protein